MEKNYLHVTLTILPRAKDELQAIRALAGLISSWIDVEQEDAFKPILAKLLVDRLKGKLSPKKSLFYNLVHSETKEEKRYADIKRHFPPLVWSSLFLAAFTVLEHYVSGTCDRFESLFDWKVKRDDLRGAPGIRQSHNYLASVALVAVPGRWATIVKFIKVRNCVVHYAGNAKQSRTSEWLSKYLKNTGSLELDPNGYLVFSESYLTAFIDEVEAFVDELDSNVEKRIRTLVSYMKVREVIKLVEEDGWQHVRTKGSHRQYKHPDKPGTVTIAGKPGLDVPKGTLNSILKQAGLK